MDTSSIERKFFKFLFSTRFAGILMLLFAAAIGIATFIENDFGTSSAQKVVFQAWWFELILFLFSVSLVANIIKYRMIPLKKWGLFLFHASMILIIIGAGITRYFGYEGIMHIRENEVANSFLSAETFLQFEIVKDEQAYRFDERVLFATLGNNNWKSRYTLGDDELVVRVRDFIPNPKQVLEESPEGKPTLKIVMGGAAGREEYFISPGESQSINGDLFNFNDTYLPGAINIKYSNDSLLIKTERTLTQMTMATQALDTLLPQDGYYPLKLRSLYSDGVSSFVFGDFKQQGFVRVESEDPKVKGESLTALLVDITVNDETQANYIVGKKGQPGEPAVFHFNEMSLAVSYGAKPIVIPFGLKLYDFQLERYPGTNSAASYASDVQLIDDRNNVKQDHRIFMNNILNYGGYRFFQSSFDPDEQGTYLSVNHDFWGTWVSYVGYILLTLGMIMSLFDKKSRFHIITQKLRRMRADRQNLGVIILLMTALSFSGLQAQEVDHSNHMELKSVISEEHADEFSRMIVQDPNGRMKPMHTMTREIMRKLFRKETMLNLNADQVVLSMFADPFSWGAVPMIKLGKHTTIKKMLGLEGNLATYNDFFTKEGQYKLGEEVKRAYGLQPIDRGTLEKELMKMDEKVNIASMVYSGRFFRMIPVPGDENNLWVSSDLGSGEHKIDQPVAETFFAAYLPALRNGIQTGDFGLANVVLEKLAEYQQKEGAAVIPSENKQKAEILLNNLGVFNTLAFTYFILGLLSLLLLFVSVFKPNLNLNIALKILLGLIIAGFLFHTLGLGLRWYISGRAPWSNGYETMIYIAWTTTLAGLLFSRKNFGGLTATMILAAIVLLVAALSYLDPEITPLVPVLRSYWLTIHVSLEAGSYGFLMLGAIIGLINLILMIFLTESNKERIRSIVQEMSYISELTLIGGLFMVSIGTYLGGVWANESWGRYWGWDAKETWALVTILVYAFILHMRLIPKIQGLYAYNLASIFGWASVVMTYYGVNYYLSGLHSYAAGDPVPIPMWVYYVVVGVTIVSIVAYFRKKKFPIIS